MEVFIEKRLRAAQRVLGSRMWPSEQWLKTTAVKGAANCANVPLF